MFFMDLLPCNDNLVEKKKLNVKTKHMNIKRVLALVILVFPFMSSSQVENRHKISLEYSWLATNNQLRFYTIVYENGSLGVDPSVDQSKEITRMNTVAKMKPIQLQYDYFVTNKSSINLSVNVSSFSAQGAKIDSSWNPTSSTYSVSENDLHYNMFRTRIMLGYMRHFPLKNDRFTLFGSVKLGCAINKQHYTVNYLEQDVNSSGFAFDGNLLAGMISFGLNYRIIPKLEFTGSVGIGGPLLSFGLRKSF